MQLLALIPNDVLEYILYYLDFQDLCRIEISWKNISTVLACSPHWKALCDLDYSSYPRYRCQQHGYPIINSYKKSYEFLFHEVRRNVITVHDLESREWYFNYTRLAGGRGKETLVKCFFRDQYLHLRGYTPLRYFISENATASWLGIANFPHHDVTRMPDGEWLITNEAVTFVSCVSKDFLTYRDRGFQ